MELLIIGLLVLLNVQLVILLIWFWTGLKNQVGIAKSMRRDLGEIKKALDNDKSLE